MSTECNLELELGTSNGADRMEEGSGERRSDESLPMTIFYRGRVWSYDVSELQCRAILTLARHEMSKERDESGGRGRRLPASIQQRLCSGGPVSGLSMKASLQRFLQKRRLRALARSPY